MAKRIAEKPLNYENWDEPDVKVDSGTFEKADEATLRTRKLIVPRRKSTQPPAQKLGLFTSFDGFGTSSKNTLDTSIFHLNTAKNHEDDYLNKLATLNKDVSAWISKHVSEDPYCILTPIFADYASHLSSIESLKKSPVKTNSITDSPAQSSTNAFGLMNSKSDSVDSTINKFTAPTSASSNTLQTSGFSFKLGSGSLLPSEPAYASKPPSFNFGPLTAENKSKAAPSQPLFSFSPSVAKKTENCSTNVQSTSLEQGIFSTYNL